MERILTPVRKGGRFSAPSTMELAAERNPCVILYRQMGLMNNAAPGSILFVRAYPFDRQTYHGDNRQVRMLSFLQAPCLNRPLTPGRCCTQDCVFCIPEFCPDRPDQVQRTADYVLPDYAEHTWVGRVICFFTAFVRDGIDSHKHLRLAFVHFAEEYIPTPGAGMCSPLSARQARTWQPCFCWVRQTMPFHTP